MPMYGASSMQAPATSLVEPGADQRISVSQDSAVKRWVPLNEAARIVHMSSKTLRLDVNANLIPSRRSAPRGGIEVDLDAAIDRYAGGAPLASRLFIAFGEGRTPIEMVVETGLDPILVKRMWVAYIDMTRDPSVIQAKKNCRECTRTEAQCEQFSKEFAEACERTRVHDVKCCVRCHVPLTWNDDGENA